MVQHKDYGGQCQQHGCTDKGVVRILYTLEGLDDQHVGAFACPEHEDDVWEHFDNHDIWTTVGKESV